MKHDGNMPAVQPDHVADSGKKVSISCGHENDVISRKAAIDAIHGRTFKEIVVRYPTYTTYPERKGKPYFSIKYTENGQEFIGYSTYKPEVLSEYLKEDFMPSAQPEPKWIPCSERLPEKNCRCLTTNKAWGSFEVDWNAWIDGRWLYPNEKPIAWMPLPEPYRGGGKE